MPVVTRARALEQLQVIQTDGDLNTLLQQAFADDAEKIFKAELEDDTDGWELECPEEELAYSPFGSPLTSASSSRAASPMPSVPSTAGSGASKRPANSPPPTDLFDIHASGTAVPPPSHKRARRGKRKSGKNHSQARKNRSRADLKKKAALAKASSDEPNYRPSRHAAAKIHDLSVIDSERDPEQVLHASSHGFVGKRMSVGNAHTTVEAYLAEGYRRVPWNGISSHGITGVGGHLLGLMIGRPTEPTYMQAVRRLETAIDEAHGKLELGAREDRRGSFDTIAFGVSFGGGQKRPGNLKHSVNNLKVMEDLLANPDMRRLASYAKSVFATYFPDLYEEYVRTLEQLHEDNPLLRPLFKGCAWPALSINFPPNSFSNIHTDAGNKANGMCPIFSLGNFDHTKGGHLVLPDLKLVIEFPAGSLIFIPSATLRHGNIPVRPQETRTSWTLYAAGGLFRWVEYGFQTWVTLRAKDPDRADEEEAKHATRWKAALEKFPTIDSLKARVATS